MDPLVCLESLPPLNRIPCANNKVLYNYVIRLAKATSANDLFDMSSSTKTEHDFSLELLGI